MQKIPLLLLFVVILSSLDIVAGQQEEHWCSRCKLREQKEFDTDPLLCDEFFPGRFSSTVTRFLSTKYGGVEKFAPGWKRKINLRSSVAKDKKRKNTDGDEPASPVKPRKNKKRKTEIKNLEDPPDTSWDEFFATMEAEASDLDLEPVVTACGDYAPSTCLPPSSPDQFGWSSEEEDATELPVQENL